MVARLELPFFVLEIAASTVCLRESADRLCNSYLIDLIQCRPGSARFVEHNGGLLSSVACRCGKRQAGPGRLSLQVMCGGK